VPGSLGTSCTRHALTILKTEGVDGQEARASFFATEGPVGRVVEDQAISVSLQEIDAPSSWDRYEPGDNRLDIFELKARATFLAAWYELETFFADGELQGFTEAVLAVVVQVAPHVS
jgi:hypothetical protein